jgi:hypothetical protein
MSDISPFGSVMPQKEGGFSAQRKSDVGLLAVAIKVNPDMREELSNLWTGQ